MTIDQVKPNFPTRLGFLMDYNYRRPKHIKLIESKIFEMLQGKFHKLLVTMPPRHGKSELLSKFFPSWLLMMKPESRIILTSYQSSFAAQWGLKVRNILREFKLVDPHKSASNSFLTTNGGSFHTCGVDGAITGKGADWLIIDDPIKNDKAAFSSVQRESVWNFYLATATTRLEPNGHIIVIQTRWHHDDLAGRILAAENDWEVVNIPAIAKDNDILERKEGEALWPERYPIDKLIEIKKTIGEYWFNALYQQNPSSPESEIIKREYWQDCTDYPVFDFVIQSWDTAFKTNEMNDYSVCTTWGSYGNNRYLIDCKQIKLEYPALKKMIVANYETYNPKVILIEDKASGQSLIQDLKQTRLPIISIKVESDKVSRAHLTTPQFSNNLIYLNKTLPFAKDVISECAEFPFGAHDDIVDSITQAINYLSSFSKPIHITNW